MPETTTARATTTAARAALPTIADVAREAGVSTATVSRCLNAPSRVRSETREAVEKAVAKLGYTPNFGARALMAGRTGTVAAIIPTMENAIFARGLQAFQEALNAAGRTLLVATSQYREDLEAQQVRTLVSRGVDGILLIGYSRAPELYDLLDRRGIATLTAWAHDPSRSRPAVGFDNVDAMASMTREVIARGHERIAMISGHAVSNDRAAGRIEGVRRALREAGRADGLRVIETDYAIEAGEAAAGRLLEASERPTAIVCGNDVLAFGVLREARRRGLSVPGDISVTGFDDIELARLAEPALATVHVPHARMGREAARILLAAIDGGGGTSGMALETHVVLRASLGTAP